jgi:hypothetical protein
VITPAKVLAARPIPVVPGQAALWDDPEDVVAGTTTPALPEIGTTDPESETS